MLSSIPVLGSVWSEYKHAIEWGLRVFADGTGSAGLAVIVFTILIKTVLLPLTIKSVRSTYAMQELQPKIKDLQKRYGKDRQRISAETMKLYQEHGVSPASGCLPMLLQMPIFFGLYFAIRGLASSHVGVWGQGFLWLPSLADPDPYKILPILAGLFQLIQTRMTRPAGLGKIDDPQQQMMQTMTTFMPLMVVVFGWRFASGPVLYWVTQSAYSVVQQWFISGWGSMLDWFPFLPDLPEHRRLGYEHPDKKAQRIANAGQKSGLFGMLQAQVEKQQTRVIEGQGGPDDTGSTGTSVNGRAKPANASRGSGARSANEKPRTNAKGGRSYPSSARGGPTGDGAVRDADLVPRRTRGKRKPS